MKKIILFLSLFLVSTSSFSQVGIFQHLNEIRDDSMPGELNKETEKKGYTYYVYDASINTTYAYRLTEELYCYMTVVKPNSSEILQNWVQNLNQKWVIVDDNKWKFYREDGNILQCVLVNTDNTQIFVFSIKKFKKNK